MSKVLPVFQTWASKKQALVSIAAVTPFLTGLTWTLVVNSTYPMGIRLLFATMIGIFALILVGPLHRLFTCGPTLEINEHGFMWRGWSPRQIPWEAVERWKQVSYLGTRYITVWLRDPHRYPSSTAAGWTQWANGWLGQGHISIPSGALNSSFDEIVTAFGRFAPKPPLPSDPRLARRTQRNRDPRL